MIRGFFQCLHRGIVIVLLAVHILAGRKGGENLEVGVGGGEVGVGGGEVGVYDAVQAKLSRHSQHAAYMKYSP